MLYTAAALFEYMKLPYSGCPAASLAILARKIDQKRFMLAAGLPTPDYMEDQENPRRVSRWIVKSDSEHASVGMDATSIVDDGESALAKIAAMKISHGGNWFAEQYIEGREFNVAILEDPTGGTTVLPIAEMTFVGFEPHQPKIVDYAAKWDPESDSYYGTQRQFIPDGVESDLVTSLTQLSLKCWDLFGLRGAARVDFRVDQSGTPWILEVNPNPCLASDAGFMAAARQAGLSPNDVIACLLGAL